MPEAFLTGVDTGGSSSQRRVRHQDVVPSRIKADNQKLVEVVDAFRAKVDLMVNKQREEYEDAYEHHMEGIQKELHY